MSRLTLLSNDMPIAAWLAWLRRTSIRDPRTARRAALLRLVWQEAHLTHEGLIARIEALLGQNCFGPSPRATFYCDISAVRQTLAEAGHRLTYRRRSDRRGYCVEGRPSLDEHLQQLIAGAVSEVDPKQIAIYRQLVPAQRIWQMSHLSDWLRLANERRLQRKGMA